MSCGKIVRGKEYMQAKSDKKKPEREVFPINMRQNKTHPMIMIQAANSSLLTNLLRNHKRMPIR